MVLLHRLSGRHIKLVMLALAGLVLLCFQGGFYAAAAQDLVPAPRMADQTRADTLFQSCLTTKPDAVSEVSHEASCACMAANMASWESAHTSSGLTPDRSLDLLQRRGSGEGPDENTLAVEIYAPCLYLTAYDIAHDSCLHDRRFHIFTSVPEELDSVCHCYARGIEEYFEHYAVPFLEFERSRVNNIGDPVTRVRASADFMVYERDLHRDCGRRLAMDRLHNR